ncbi:hypothetical protein BGZ63DRAFT_409487 [Mariannaea sp. PMI_226]|nr:hypothetical protein BGZ63DRAFT_409487 [Mariannaea sp. PMI_226]
MNKISSLVRPLMVDLNVLWICSCRLWRQPWRTASTQFENQARLLAQTSTSWIYLTAPICPPRVIKLSKNGAMLRQEYELHAEIAVAFKTLQEELSNGRVKLDLPYIPECYYFFPKISESIYAGMFKDSDTKKAAGFTMEYIHPFSPTHV